MPTLPELNELARRFQTGELDCLDLTEACLASIDVNDDALNAWVLVDRDGARQAAKTSTQEIRQGRWKGPLHGIPVGVKDIFDVAGWPTKAGSPLRTDHRATQDSALVARLRECGAVILGKTVTTEFACFDPSQTRNPWALDHTPGGSSSGSAAGMAAGMCLLATGSQTGGSVIRPAAYCGIVGYKPTFGLLPREGMVPVSRHLDHPGLFGRCAADVHAAAKAICPGWNQLGDRRHPPQLLRPRGFYENATCDEMLAAFDDVATRFAAAGADVADLDEFIDWESALTHHYRIMAVEAAENHRVTFTQNEELYGPKIAGLIHDGLRTRAVDYLESLAAQRQFRRQIMRTLSTSIVLTPAAPGPAPAELNTTGDPRFNSLFTLAGVPAVTIPAGLTKNGLPWAIQLVGNQGEDELLLHVTRWCEQLLGFDATPDTMGRE